MKYEQFLQAIDAAFALDMDDEYGFHADECFSHAVAAYFCREDSDSMGIFHIWVVSVLPSNSYIRSSLTTHLKNSFLPAYVTFRLLRRCMYVWGKG